jgi:hypothetical protein
MYRQNARGKLGSVCFPTDTETITKCTFQQDEEELSLLFWKVLKVS